MMKKNVSAILKELLLLDGSLKKHEKELSGILQEIIRAKPEMDMDTDFSRELREELLDRFQEKYGKKESDPSSFFSSFRFWEKAILLTAGFLIAFIPFQFVNWNVSPDKKGDDEVTFDFSPELVSLQKDAFGDFSSSPAIDMRGMGGGGGGADVKMMENYSESLAGDHYEFVFDGEIPIPETSVLPVYHRVTHKDSQQAINEIAGSLDLGLLDFQAFEKSGLSFVTFSQQIPYGYSTNVSLDREEIFISPLFEYWPNPFEKCWGSDLTPEESSNCASENELTLEDVPSDADLVSQAEEFLAKHGIDASLYGTPYVNSEWKLNYDRTLAENANTQPEYTVPPYIPEEIPVIFPEYINETQISDALLQKTGLTVNVNIREMKVSGVMNLTTRRYEESEYEAVSDPEKLREVLRKGGMNPPYFIPVSESEKTIVVGKPEFVYYKKSEYREFTSDEYLIPAYLFPIEKKPSDPFFTTNYIIVPLIPLEEESVDEIPQLLSEPDIVR